MVKHKLSNYFEKKLIYIILLLYPINAAADAGNDPIGTSICSLITYLRGDFAQVIEMVGVLYFGMQGLSAKLRWEVALMCVAGITLISQVPSILEMITGDNASACFAQYTWTTNTDPINDSLCRILLIFRSKTMGAIAIVAIMVLAIQFFKGNIKQHTVLIIITSIIILYKAPSIILTIRNETHHTSDICKPLFAPSS